MFWLTVGDSNSKFFHAYASARKKLNFVNHLRTEEGELVSGKEEMQSVVLEYFHRVFAGKGEAAFVSEERDVGMISEEQNLELIVEISFEEFTRAVKQMHPHKASGPDGLNPAFFRIFGQVWGGKCIILVKSGCDWVSSQRI